MDASVDFEDRDFSAAFSKLRGVVEPKTFAQLTEADAVRALSLAARCSSILEGEEAAKRYIERIPESKRVNM